MKNKEIRTKVIIRIRPVGSRLVSLRNRLDEVAAATVQIAVLSGQCGVQVRVVVVAQTIGNVFRVICRHQM